MSPEEIAGLAWDKQGGLLPAVVQDARTQNFIQNFVRLSQLAAISNTLGLTRPFYSMGDKIGLPPQGGAEKRRGFVSGRHARTAANEVSSWKASSQQGEVAVVEAKSFA